MTSQTDPIPQILGITKVGRNGTTTLKKAARQRLGDDALFLVEGDEMLLTDMPSQATVPVELRGRRILLSESVLETLGVQAGSLLAMVGRPDGVALKRLLVEEQPGEHAAIVDHETRHAIRRVAMTNAPAKALLSSLEARHEGARPCYDVRVCLADRPTLPAWQARRLLGCAEPADDGLCQRLIDERLAAQCDDGSWGGNVLLTARKLRELAELGLPQGDTCMARAVSWLMARPQSEHNPGQWFGTDKLVADQSEIIAARQRGEGGRFRKVLTSEKKRVMAADDLIRMPCGPRIMWPTALVLETLLLVGCEGHERVQTVLHTLTTEDWCECSYQHGLSDWQNDAPLTEDALTAFEDQCRRQYHFGGYEDLGWLTGSESPSRSERVSVPDGDGYRLLRPDHMQGCEFITTRALARVQQPTARRFAQAHLWRFAGIQRTDGTFPDESYGTGLSQVGILEAISRHDHPAARIILLRALPWLLGAQNPDGSWGEAALETATLAAVRVLGSLGILGAR